MYPFFVYFTSGDAVGYDKKKGLKDDVRRRQYADFNGGR